MTGLPSWMNAFNSLADSLASAQDQNAPTLKPMAPLAAGTHCWKCHCPIAKHSIEVVPSERGGVVLPEGGGPIGCTNRTGIVGAMSQWWFPYTPCWCPLTREEAAGKDRA